MTALALAGSFSLGKTRRVAFVSDNAVPKRCSGRLEGYFFGPRVSSRIARIAAFPDSLSFLYVYYSGNVAIPEKIFASYPSQACPPSRFQSIFFPIRSPALFSRFSFFSQALPCEISAVIPWSPPMPSFGFARVFFAASVCCGRSFQNIHQ